MYEFLFKYSPVVFNDSELILANSWPLWLMLASAILFTIFIVAALGWKRNTLKWWQLSSIGLLQLLMFAVVLLVLWQPALLTERLVKGENAVAILLDTSSSMTTFDGEQTRMAQAQALLTPESLEELSSTYTILPYVFDDNAEDLESFNLLPQPGNSSNLGVSILQTLRQSSSTSLGALILLSDGADNSGSISQAELSEIASFGVPIHTIGLGRETMPEDLELEDVLLPATALPGTTLSARVSIRHDQGGLARIKVYDGDTFLSTEEVNLNPEQTITIAYIDIEVAEPGQLDLRFTIDPINGERNLNNNTRSQVVNVLESKYKILYIEGEPRWEYKFLQRALDDDPSIQLSTLLRVTPNKYYRQGIDSSEQLADGFPLERAELFSYDALIIGSVSVSEFSEDQQTMISDFVSERGGSLMMLAGLSGLGQGGWGESVVNDILPARLSFDDDIFVRDKVPVVLTDSGANAPMLRFSDSPSENAALWNELPDVADYQGIGPLRPAASVLLEVNVDGRLQPLLTTQPYGRGQTYILATGGTWRWQMSMPLEDMSHETFWRQLSRSLVANSPRPFELSTSTENEQIIVRAEVRDPEDEENQGLAVSAVISSDNEVINVELLPLPGQPGIYEASFTPAANGLYAIEAISRIDDNPVSSIRTALRFEQGQEAFNTRQNRTLLEQLSATTNGQYWTADQWQEIPEAIGLSSAGITEQEIRYLWDAPIFFILLLALKTIEWLLRRRWRTI